VYGFLLAFLCKFVPKTHRFRDIQLQKCRDLENRVSGPSRSFKISHSDRAHTTSYWRFTVAMAPSRVVSEIFNVKRCRDLEIGVQGHSRSSKVLSFDVSYTVSYYRSLVTLSLKRTVFWDIWGHRENYTIQSGVHDFLLTFHSNHRPMSHHFRDKRRYSSKIARKSPIFPTPVY